MVHADIGQLRTLINGWRAEAMAVGALDWSALGLVAGEGCAAAKEARECEVPVIRTKGSISTRFGVMAGQIEGFLADVSARDAETAAHLHKLSRQ